MGQKYHVNPRTGGVSACGAKIQCPFGDMKDDHYDDRGSALKAYEKKMQGSAVPAPRKVSSDRPTPKSTDPSAGLMQRDLRKLAKSSDDEKVLSMAVKNGDEGVLRAVSENYSANLDHLRTIEARSNNKGTLKKVQEHYNYVPKEFTPENTAALARDGFRVKNLYPAIHGEASDKFVAFVARNAGDYSKAHEEIVSTPNKSVTIETRVASLNKPANSFISEEVAKRESFPASELLPHMSHRQKASYSRYGVESKALDALADESVAKIKEGYPAKGKGDELADSLYKNEATSAESRAKIVEVSPKAQSLERLKKMKSDFPDDYDKLVKERKPAGNSATAQESYVLDTERIKKMGMTDGDVYTYMQEKNHLFSPKFDSVSGVYTGYRD